MSETCEVCGQFTGRTASFDLWIRGLDRRGEGDRIEIDVSDVSVGECCGLDVLQGPDETRVDRSYQRYLNSTPDGELRYVVMIRDEIETDSDTDTVQLHPITGNYLPESIGGYVWRILEPDNDEK
jgi:hypothetical protein